jgi:hypothetical protein
MVPGDQWSEVAVLLQCVQQAVEVGPVGHVGRPWRCRGAVARAPARQRGAGQYRSGLRSPGAGEALPLAVVQRRGEDPRAGTRLGSCPLEPWRSDACTGSTNGCGADSRSCWRPGGVRCGDGHRIGLWRRWSLCACRGSGSRDLRWRRVGPPRFGSTRLGARALSGVALSSRANSSTAGSAAGGCDAAPGRSAGRDHLLAKCAVSWSTKAVRCGGVSPLRQALYQFRVWGFFDMWMVVTRPLAA